MFFWRPWDLFCRPFGASVVSFGVLVSSFWVPLARLGFLWTLSATFCGAFGSSGLSVRSGIGPGLFSALFSIHFCVFLSNSGVAFEVFLILVLSGSAFGFCSWCGCLGLFRNGIRWIWERRGRRMEDEQKEIQGPPITNGPPVSQTATQIQQTSVELQSSSPALPETGLPDGWSMEQWEHYGQQYLDRIGKQP